MFTGYFIYSGQEIPGRTTSVMTDTAHHRCNGSSSRNQNTFSICHKEHFKRAESNRSHLIFCRKWCKTTQVTSPEAQFLISTAKVSESHQQTQYCPPSLGWSLIFSLSSRGGVLNSDSYNTGFPPKYWPCLSWISWWSFTALKLQANTWIRRFFSFLGKWLQGR